MKPGNDSPIEDVGDDRLGRASAARLFVERLGRLDVSDGSVVAVTGPWGSGKSSFIALARNVTPKGRWAAELEFNPWLFSGTDQLVTAFFREVGAQLQTRDSKLRGIGENFDTYGDLLSAAGELPWVGSVMKVAKAAKQVYDKKHGSILDQRTSLSHALRKLDLPVLIVIDDIDRLTANEVRDVFKLVRLTGSFPNILYVLAFDRARVEHALGDNGTVGRDYLEKIVQLSIDLPEVPREVLIDNLTRELDLLLKEIPKYGPFDVNRWPDILSEVVAPLIVTMRDVKRYLTAVDGTIRGHSDMICLEDLLALEALRVFRPEMVAAIARYRDVLTTTAELPSSQEAQKQRFSDFMDAAGDEELAASVVRRMFEAGRRHLDNQSFGRDFAKRWIRSRRVAHPDILDLFLQQSPNEALRAFTDAETLVQSLTNADQLRQRFDALPAERREPVIRSLEFYEGEYPIAGVENGVALLLNAAAGLPDRPVGMFDLDPKMAVTRVVLRMLKQLPDAAAVEQAVKAVLPRLTSLSSQAALISLVGYTENAGHRLVSETFEQQRLEELYDEFQLASPRSLSEEWDLLRLLFDIKRWADRHEKAFALPVDRDLSTALLLNATTDLKRQSWESRAVQRNPRLHWKVLTELWGEDKVDQHLALISQNADKRIKPIVALAEKYRSGWDPEGDDE